MTTRLGCILSLVLALGFWASSARADYSNPPGWESNPYFTHQSWDLDTPDNPLAPDGDPVVDNPYGNPEAELVDGLWIDTWYHPTRTNGWLFLDEHQKDDPDPLARVVVPNTPNSELTKEIWFQATLQTNMPDLANDLEIEIFPNGVGQGITAGDDVEVEILDPALGLVRATLWFTLDEQPDFEVLEFRGDMEAGDFIWVDQFDVDTRCISTGGPVPEPASIVLAALAIPGLVLLRRRRRR